MYTIIHLVHGGGWIHFRETWWNISIPFSYHSPDTYVDANIKGTLNVLQAAIGLEIERILVTSTLEVCGTAQYVPIDELHPFQGQSPYFAAKIGEDRLVESFYRLLICWLQLSYLLIHMVPDNLQGQLFRPLSRNFCLNKRR